MTTTSQNHNFAWMATSVVALALGLMVCANAFAQNVPASRGAGTTQNPAGPRVVAMAEDMRLWSFGDCDRRFPYTGTPEHQECVRVVGSLEAVEARALHVCDVSHSSDNEEAERCKANYRANKAKAAAEGLAANAPATPQAPPSEEVMRRVKAIGSAAVDEQRATTSTPKAPAVGEEAKNVATPGESTWKGTLMTVVLVAFGVGFGVNLVRRRQAQSA